VIVKGNKLFASDTALAAVEFDLDSNSSKPACDFGKAGYNSSIHQSNGIFLHERSNQLFVADIYEGVVLACNLHTREARVEFVHSTSVNDVFVDSRGRIWFTVSVPVRGAGPFFAGFAKPQATGELWIYDPRSKQRRRLASGLLFANGLHIDELSNTVYVSESTANRVSAFKVTLFDGTVIAGPTTFASLPGPDVMKVHESGDLIVGSVTTNKVFRVSKKDGSVHPIFSWGDDAYARSYDDALALGKNLVETLSAQPAFGRALSGAFLAGNHHLYVGGFTTSVAIVRI
jgi:hypothetical protein